MDAARSLSLAQPPEPINTGSGFDCADFLLNQRMSLPSATAMPIKVPASTTVSAYSGAKQLDHQQGALGLNYGIRWDYTSPFTELYNRLANLDIGQGFSTANVVVGGQAPRKARTLVRRLTPGYLPLSVSACKPLLQES